jgi:hypothetical protein
VIPQSSFFSARSHDLPPPAFRVHRVELGYLDEWQHRWSAAVLLALSKAQAWGGIITICLT